MTPVKKEELSQDYTGNNEINIFEMDNENSKADSVISRVKALLKSYESLNQAIFKVSNRLTNPGKLIVAAQNIS